MRTTRMFLLLLMICLLDSPEVFPQNKNQNKKATNGFNESGKPHGQWIYYFDRENQIIQSTGRYKNGAPVGRWILYYPDGRRDVVTRYYRNKARERRYAPWGTIEKKGWSRLILDDEEAVRYYWDGRWRIYNEKGRLQSVVVYQQGEPVRVIREK